MLDAIVDPEDRHLLSKYNWIVRKGKYGYICTWYGLFLHRIIAKAKSGEIVDHINRNPRDNRRNNLRITNHRINRLNSDQSDKAELVYLNKGRYEARTTRDGKAVYLGSYKTKEEALAVAKRYKQTRQA